MSSRIVKLPGHLVLVPGKSLAGNLSRARRDHPHLPAGLDQVEQDLGAMTAESGVPATVSEPRQAGQGRSLRVYGRTYVLRLFPTDRGGGYIIAAITPLRLSDHHQLAEACLKLRPAGWETRFELRQIPAGASAHWGTIVDAWADCVADRSTSGYGAAGLAGLTPGHTAFLDTLDRLIDATQQITTQPGGPDRLFPYREVTATGERRHGTRAVYDFRMTGGQAPAERAFVQVHGEPEQRGQVTRVTPATPGSPGMRVTVRFDMPVDWERLSQQGRLEVTPSSVVYDKQREAVAALRTGRARNQALLPVLVDHRVVPIQPVAAQPAEHLDDDQLTAFRKALGVEDILLVLGPPGTGKTRVISQTARACALDGGRVLVSSLSNRAVDNVLGRLPPDLLAIRVGNDGRVTEEGRPYLLEQQVAELRTRVLNVTGRALAAYERVNVAVGWAGELDHRDDALRVTIGAESDARTELAAARRQTGGGAQTRVDGAAAELRGMERELGRQRGRVDRLAARLERARSRTRWPVAGGLFGMLGRRLGRQLHTERARGDSLRDASERTRGELAAAQRELDTVTRDHPAVKAAAAEAEAATRRRGECRDAALVAATAVCEAVSGVVTPPFVMTNEDLSAAEAQIADLRSWLAATLPLLVVRAGLLADWHGEVSGASDQLYPELVRYADVVAATCTGAASRPEISGLDFDLAIVDEAGQIGVADVLVPLVRARRGVLVGDHLQLPPFLDSEVEQWGKSIDDGATRELMTKSALELLIADLPDSHIVWLTGQRRMPAMIADFVSEAFYEGRLRTCVERVHADPVFGRPLAFVDTARLPGGQRNEKSGRARERWGQPGYTNPAEASLLVSLAAGYHRNGADWAVIVPYRAQAAEIVSALVGMVGDATLIELNVGTVDSFQGGERDVILYGFTRSNPHGNVGFLAELRRLNVAYTRARQQLVLVGDLDTLTSARDPGFRELVSALRDHAGLHGEICSYADVRGRLASMGWTEAGR
jgi:AAA domain